MILSCCCLYVHRKSLAFFIGSYQKVDETDHKKDGHYRSDTKTAAGKEITQLIDTKRNHISKSALITDRGPEPFHVVHLSLDRTHSCEARCTQEVKYQERISCDLGHAACQLSPNLITIFCHFSKSKENTKGTYYVFFCDQTGNGCNCHLPVAPQAG